MNKPTTLPRWATDETNNDAPSSGQQDTGWTEEQDSVSSFFNWLFFWIYQWILYFKGTLTTVQAIGVAKWQLVTGGVFTGGAALNNSYWENGSGIQLLVHSLDLPVGAVVTSLTAGYVRGGGGTVSLLLLSVTDGVESGGGVPVTLFADSTGTSFEKTTVTDFDGLGNPLTIQANTTYQLFVKMTNTANQFYGVTDLTWTRESTP